MTHFPLARFRRRRGVHISFRHPVAGAVFLVGALMMFVAMFIGITVKEEKKPQRVFPLLIIGGMSFMIGSALVEILLDIFGG